MNKNPDSAGLSYRRVRQFLFAELRPLPFTLASVLTAGLYFFCLFDLSFITEGRYWKSGAGDPAQHLIGYFAFVHDPWRFPLFSIQNLGYPHGANIIFTDSIPALSLLFKMIRPLVPAGFHPFGLWIFVCYLLLAHAFSSVQYELGHRSLWSAVSSSLFVVLSPILLFRIELAHAALCGHFLVVYALLLYLRDFRVRKVSWVWPTLLLLALWIHPYLFAMTVAIYLCSLLTALWQDNRAWKELARGLALTTGALFLAAYLSGFFAQSVLLTDPLGFGHYSMNLLSPLSLRYESYDGTGGQIEGFNYWEVGTLLLLLVSAPALFKVRKRFHPSVLVFVLCLAGLTLLAVSNRVYLGHWLLLSYNVPNSAHGILEIFRSSGRFFWPVSYTVMAIAVWGALNLRPALAVVILSIGIATQWVDTLPIRTMVGQMVKESPPTRLDDARVRQVVAAHKLVTLVPAAQCQAPDDLYGGPGIIAAESGVKLASIKAGRYTWEQLESCRTLERDLLINGFEDGNLYFLTKPVFRSVRLRPGLAKFCTQLDGYNLCSTRLAEFALSPLSTEWKPTLWSEKQVLQANRMADFLGVGWSYLERARSGLWATNRNLFSGCLLVISRRSYGFSFFRWRERVGKACGFRPTTDLWYPANIKIDYCMSWRSRLPTVIQRVPTCASRFRWSIPHPPSSWGKAGMLVRWELRWSKPGWIRRIGSVRLFRTALNFRRKVQEQIIAFQSGK